MTSAIATKPISQMTLDELAAMHTARSSNLLDPDVATEMVRLGRISAQQVVQEESAELLPHLTAYDSWQFLTDAECRELATIYFETDYPGKEAYKRLFVNEFALQYTIGMGKLLDMAIKAVGTDFKPAPSIRAGKTLMAKFNAKHDLRQQLAAAERLARLIG